MEGPFLNTDKELWRKDQDYYAPSIHVTKEGAIGINVGGLVIIRTVEDWHKLAAPTLKGQPMIEVTPEQQQTIYELVHTAALLSQNAVQHSLIPPQGSSTNQVAQVPSLDPDVRCMIGSGQLAAEVFKTLVRSHLIMRAAREDREGEELEHQVRQRARSPRTI